MWLTVTVSISLRIYLCFADVVLIKLFKSNSVITYLKIPSYYLYSYYLRWGISDKLHSRDTKSQRWKSSLNEVNFLFRNELFSQRSSTEDLSPTPALERPPGAMATPSHPRPMAGPRQTFLSIFFSRQMSPFLSDCTVHTR